MYMSFEVYEKTSVSVSKPTFGLNQTSGKFQEKQRLLVLKTFARAHPGKSGYRGFFLETAVALLPYKSPWLDSFSTIHWYCHKWK